MNDSSDMWQLFPNLAADEYDALKADIAERGVLVPVEYDEDGSILDGHHRVRACRELGIKDWPTVTRGGMDDEAKAEHVLTLNLSRRHLSRDQRRELVRKLRTDRGWSLRRIAERLGISVGQAHSDARQVFSSEQQPNRVEGADGKSYAATKPKPAPSEPTDHLLDFDSTPQPPRPEQPPEEPTPRPVAPEPSWPEDQAKRRDQLLEGVTLVVNMATEKMLWDWAQRQGKAVRVDRKSRWGNPFIVNEDGDRDAVCDLYVDVYWPHKPSLHAAVNELDGMALGCWCHPQRCHADHLADQAVRS